MISVTKPFLPPLEEYNAHLSEIWERNWLTNHGPIEQKLESELKNYLNLDYLHMVTNGTIALQIAINALELRGEIITTPFSYVATASSIVWEKCKPVFIDIDPATLNIDPDKITDAVTEKTTGILATHVFGNPCDIEKIKSVALEYGLKVIYDGAHAFGTKYKGNSLLDYGDLTTCSFHATKLFHSIEGGAVITKNKGLARKVARIRNFGHKNFEIFEGVGINGKSSEFHAAMGLCNLKHINAVLAKRKHQSELYDKLLKSAPIERPVISNDTEHNYSYYPIILENESVVTKVGFEMFKANIQTRRYFYPPLHYLPYVEKVSLPIVESISPRTICLPLYHTLTDEEIHLVADELVMNL